MTDTNDTKEILVGGNTIQNFRARKWCFTLNNYTKEDKIKLTHIFDTKKCKYIIGEEKGEKGTIHLQGYFEAKNAIWFKSIKKWNEKLHVEKARGNRESNIKYCIKENKFITNFEHPILFKKKIENDILIDEYKDVKWKDWQKEVINLINEKADSRKIYVYIDYMGNSGKSYLTKFIALKYKGVVICDGKKDNIFNQVKVMMDSMIEPKIVILDVPRSGKDFINYGVVEQLKNGLIYSGKYEGGRCLFRHPHVIIFTNDNVDINKLSIDRWVIKDI